MRWRPRTSQERAERIQEVAQGSRGRPQTSDERTARIAEVARGTRWAPVPPTIPCARCGGAWVRDAVDPGDPSGIRHLWSCFYCGEVYYGT